MGVRVIHLGPALSSVKLCKQKVDLGSAFWGEKSELYSSTTPEGFVSCICLTLTSLSAPGVKTACLSSCSP